MTDTLQLCVDALEHHRRGRLTEAERCYRTALGASPDDQHALHGLGLLLLAARRPGEAGACWERLVARDPGAVSAWVRLANARSEAGDSAGALQACREALRLEPDRAEALTALGAASLAAGEVANAIAAFRGAAELAPRSGAAWAGLATGLIGYGAVEAALEAAETACACEPRLAQAWFARGTALSSLGRPKEAVEALRRAVAEAPSEAHAQLNLGNAMLDLDRRTDAEAAIRHSIELDPSLPEAHASLGYLLAGDSRAEAAVAACATAIALRPSFAEAHWNQGIAYLLGGDFANGWEKFEWRKRHPTFAADLVPLDSQEWRGEEIAGRTLLVRAEQGLGDTIQCARFLPLLAARGAAVVLACRRSLMALLAPLVQVVDCRTPLPPHDLWVDLMSVPRLLGVRVDTIPAADGYLTADPGRVGVWKRRLAGAPAAGPLVGIVWAGNPAHRNDRRRSMPIAAWTPILSVPSCRFVGLQVGADHAAASDRFAIPDLSASLTDFAETAALVSALDLVIAVDTSTAHLAGALGVPVWVMLPFSPDWRWMIGRMDTPWYRSMRLFRQDAARDWSATAACVARALADATPALRRAATPAGADDGVAASSTRRAASVAGPLQ